MISAWPATRSVNSRLRPHRRRLGFRLDAQAGSSRSVTATMTMCALSNGLPRERSASRRSYFQGIERVLSGEMVRLSARRSSVSRWAPRTDPFVGRSDDDLLDAMRETFDTAVGSGSDGRRARSRPS